MGRESGTSVQDCVNSHDGGRIKFVAATCPGAGSLVRHAVTLAANRDFDGARDAQRACRDQVPNLSSSQLTRELARQNRSPEKVERAVGADEQRRQDPRHLH